MTRILVVWEDRVFAQMALVVKRRLPARRRPDVAFPHLVQHTAAGNGKFAHYVRSTWTNARGSGTPGDPGPLDHLVCVVDGDKLPQLLPKTVNRVDGSEPVARWHERANDEWAKHLRANVDHSVDPRTVHGQVLRWSKESFALAGYDRPLAAGRLGLDLDSGAFRDALSACKPDPRTVPDARFSDQFRSPLQCLEELRVASGIPGSTKNTPEVDDCIKALALDHLDVLCARVPDIDLLVELLWALAAPPGSAAVPTPPNTKAASPARGSKRR